MAVFKVTEGLDGLEESLAILYKKFNSIEFVNHDKYTNTTTYRITDKTIPEGDVEVTFVFKIDLHGLISYSHFEELECLQNLKPCPKVDEFLDKIFKK